MYLSQVIKPGEMFKWKGTVKKFREEQEMVDEAEDRHKDKAIGTGIIAGIAMFAVLYGIRIMQNFS